MKKQDLLKYLILVCVICVLGMNSLRVSAQAKEAAPSAPQAAFGTAFTYQGQLLDNDAPATGEYDFSFTLYDVAEGGTPLPGTTPLTLPLVPVHGDSSPSNWILAIFSQTSSSIWKSQYVLAEAAMPSSL